MSSCHLRFVTVALLLPLAATAEWHQDRFAISFWVDPMVPTDRFDAEYARVAAANFTALLGGFGATAPGTVALQVVAARAAGLAVIPSACAGECVNVTGVWGFQVKDEPAVPDFATLAPVVARIKAKGQLAFVNLLPNYASTSPPPTPAPLVGPPGE